MRCIDALFFSIGGERTMATFRGILASLQRWKEQDPD